MHAAAQQHGVGKQAGAGSLRSQRLCTVAAGGEVDVDSDDEGGMGPLGAMALLAPPLHGDQDPDMH
jgi:hypothetical protein